MDNKKLGIIIISTAVILLILLFFIRISLVNPYDAEIERHESEGISCHADTGDCPHENKLNAQVPLIIAGVLILGFLALGFFLIFFDKSQKEIASVLENQKKIQVEEEKFDILLKGLSAEEKKVIQAVKDQDGITQQTLRLRTDLHKSKLSIVLDSLEKKGLVKRIAKGKTKQVHLKVKL